MKRRQLTAGQKAMIATELLPYYAELALKRKGHGRGGSKGSGEGGVVHPDGDGVPTPAPRRQALDEAGDAVGVGRYSVYKAQVVKDAAPELAEEVRAGTRTLNSAHEEVKRRKSGPKVRDPRGSATRKAPPPPPPNAATGEDFAAAV